MNKRTEEKLNSLIEKVKKKHETPPDRIDKAIEAFEDESLELTLGERIFNLRNALTWSAIDRIKIIQKDGVRSEEAKELLKKQSEFQKQYKFINQMYNDQLRQNKASGKAVDFGLGKDFLKKIKEEKSSVGEIVRDIRPMAKVI